MTVKEEAKQRIILTGAHHEYLKGLNSYAYFKINDHVMGEELVQETFMKTWVYLVKGGKIDMMKAFLYHVLNNLIVDQYRKHKTSSLDVLIEKGFEPREDGFDDFFNVLDGKAALTLIAELPLNYQNIMNMRYVQDLSIQEIADITGMTKNTIAVQVHRGISKLKFLYELKNKIAPIVVVTTESLFN